jgi:hypothetical protein
LYDYPLEVHRPYRAVLALEGNRVHQLLYLVLGETRPQLFEAHPQLTGAQPTRGRLRLLIPPLGEETLVGGILLEDHTVDLNVSLVNPILISLNEDCVVEFLESKPCRALSFPSTLEELDLLVLRIGALRSYTAYVFEDLSKFFLSELKAHHSTFM